MRYTITDNQGRKTIILLVKNGAHLSYQGGKFMPITVEEAHEQLAAARQAGKKIE